MLNFFARLFGKVPSPGEDFVSKRPDLALRSASFASEGERERLSNLSSEELLLLRDERSQVRQRVLASAATSMVLGSPAHSVMWGPVIDDERLGAAERSIRIIDGILSERGIRPLP